ncbi:mechanosensitive ion channel family protein [Sneathiella marina]|uniref:Mechanosensitive ion channel family protein n=1 Tax=Sneathiella marina TaxID=2950108 RepID=A0ABY4WAE4_9PROT|nr:mechanosensitive ion channel family protein [Sneathiella marina]USG62725.1 mechanosensitive ion channel family protein [Sneathiella marina]
MQSIQNFWDIVKDVWQSGYMGVDFSTIATILMILVFALLVRGIFTRFVVNRLARMAEKTENKLDDKVILAMKGPIRFIPVVVGVYFAFEVANIQDGETLAIASSKIVRSLVVFNIFWALYCAITPLTFLLGRLEEIFSTEMVSFLVKIMKGIVAGIGAATVLELWGIEVGPIIAGLGIVGVAVALGAQDLFKNLISGFLILAEKRFKAGDWVKVDGVVEGTVEKIGFRSTMIRRFDRAPTIVPNATFADRAVTNFSEMTHRRIYWKIGVEYSTTVAQMQVITEKIRDYLIENADFAQPHEATMFVVTDSFNASSIDIMIYCFTKTTNWGDWLDIKQDFAYAIKGIVEGAGTGFAFPSISVYKGEGADEPEAFEPPPDFKKGHKADAEGSLFDEHGQ